MSGQHHAPAGLPPGKEPPGIHWIGDWVDPRAGLDKVEKGKFLTLPGLEIQPLRCPAHSQSLYRLCYPGAGKEQYRVEISNRFAALESLDPEVDINRVWETVRENIKISVKESLKL
jgi:hypothetical protein